MHWKLNLQRAIVFVVFSLPIIMMLSEGPTSENIHSTIRWYSFTIYLILFVRFIMMIGLLDHHVRGPMKRHEELRSIRNIVSSLKMLSVCDYNNGTKDSLMEEYIQKRGYKNKRAVENEYGYEIYIYERFNFIHRSVMFVWNIDELTPDEMKVYGSIFKDLAINDMRRNWVKCIVPFFLNFSPMFGWVTIINVYRSSPSLEMLIGLTWSLDDYYARYPNSLSPIGFIRGAGKILIANYEDYFSQAKDISDMNDWEVYDSFLRIDALRNFMQKKKGFSEEITQRYSWGEVNSLLGVKENFDTMRIILNSDVRSKWKRS